MSLYHSGGDYIFNEIKYVPLHIKYLLYMTHHNKNNSIQYIKSIYPIMYFPNNNYESYISNIKFKQFNLSFYYLFVFGVLLLDFTILFNLFNQYSILFYCMQPCLYFCIHKYIVYPANHSILSNNWKINYYFTLLQDYIGYSSIIWRFKNIYFTNDLYNIHTNFFNEFIFLKNKALYNITLKHISFQCNMSIFYKLLFIFRVYCIPFYFQFYLHILLHIFITFCINYWLYYNNKYIKYDFNLKKLYKSNRLLFVNTWFAFTLKYNIFTLPFIHLNK